MAVKSKTETVSRTEFSAMQATMAAILERMSAPKVEFPGDNASGNGVATDQQESRVIADGSPAAHKAANGHPLPRGVQESLKRAPATMAKQEFAGDNRVLVDMSNHPIEVSVKDYKSGTYRTEKKTVHMRQHSRDRLYNAALSTRPNLKLAVLDTDGNPTDCVISLPIGTSAWGNAGTDESTGQQINIGNVQWGKKDVDVSVNVDGHNYVVKFASMYGIVTKCLG